MGGVKFNLLLVLVLSPLVRGEIIRVASYNFENYLMMDRMVSGKWQRNYPKPEKEKRALRTTINLTQPHILAIQEIENRPFLKTLAGFECYERSEVSSLCLDAKYQPARGEAFGNLSNSLQTGSFS